MTESTIRMDNAINVLANLMGVERFRLGRQIMRNDKRWRIGEICVVHAWHASVLPSFHDRAVLAVARARETEFRGQVFPPFFRAGMIVVSLDSDTLKQSAVVTIDRDPLEDAVPGLNLLADNQHCWLDGIGYELHLDTSACHSELAFANPTVPGFRRLEDAFLHIASEIAQLSKEPSVVEYLKTWRSYLDGSARKT